MDIAQYWLQQVLNHKYRKVPPKSWKVVVAEKREIQEVCLKALLSSATPAVSVFDPKSRNNSRSEPTAPKYPYIAPPDTTQSSNPNWVTACTHLVLQNNAFIWPDDQYSMAYASNFMDMMLPRRKLPTNTTRSIFSFSAHKRRQRADIVGQRDEGGLDQVAGLGFWRRSALIMWPKLLATRWPGKSNLL